MARIPFRSQPSLSFAPARLPLVGLGTALLLSAAASPARAQQSGYGQTLGTSPMDRQVYDGSGKPGGGGILDSANPLDLMNKLRRGSAMDDATPPSSAIDQALKDFDAQSGPAPAASAVSSQVKAP
ncbi:MAG: hypothetical protein NTY67_06195 [Cyanobacteria bacterium]|nr:hypothetical protein [Cyanobacteriota bacterium]